MDEAAAELETARTAGLSGAAWKPAAQATHTSSSSERSEKECLEWATRGYCYGEYATFMQASCASVCANVPEVTVTTELPVPVDPFLMLIIIAFGWGVSYVLRFAYDKDVSTNSKMRDKDDVTVGSKIANTGSAKRNKAKRS